MIKISKKESKMENFDVVIIGAGPSGSLAACKLKKEGYSVLILEKLDFPRFVIGESLLPRCNEILEENGLLELIQNQNYTIKAGAFFIDQNNNEKCIDFRNNLGQKWGTSFQVKREEFDTVLLHHAKQLGADVRHGYEVIDYDPEKNIITAHNRDKNPHTFQAKFVLDASGYGRVLPKLLDLDIPSELKLRDAIFTRVKGEIRREDDFEGFIDLASGDDDQVWIWSIPFSDGTTSIGMVCAHSYFTNTKRTQEQFFNNVIEEHPFLKKKFKDASKIAPVGIINGYSSAIKSMHAKGYALCGNATEFLDPIFSSGVTLALESSNKAASLIIKELQGQNVDWEKEYEQYMMVGINIFREFVLAWYEGKLQKIIYSQHKSPKITQSVSSILSGYVWDTNNYFASNTKRKIDALSSMV
ncbi:MAG: NAD(P)/FAD-dependent oxidoreductase [Campylobacterota bacterium]|nr:NAD(P)/FAD-dependent oxidoreductase [Campylobacterota bacterium]